MSRIRFGTAAISDKLGLRCELKQPLSHHGKSHVTSLARVSIAATILASADAAP